MLISGVVFQVFFEVLEVVNTSPKASKRVQLDTMGINPTSWWSQWWSFCFIITYLPVTLQKNLKKASACGDTILKLVLSLGSEHLSLADAHL